MFKFSGDLVLSKSWLNRALIIQSYADFESDHLDSESDDVVYLKQALQQLKSKKTNFILVRVEHHFGSSVF